MSWLHRFSLRTIIYGSFTLVLLVSMLSALLISREVDDLLRASLDTRGSHLARSLTESGALPFVSEEIGMDLLGRVQIAPGEGGVFLVDAQLEHLGSSFAGLEVEPVIAKLREVDRTKLSQGVGPLSAGPGLLFWAHPAKERRSDVIEGNAVDSERIVGYAVVVLSDKQVVEAKSRVREVALLPFVSAVFSFLVLLLFAGRTFTSQSRGPG